MSRLKNIFFLLSLAMVPALADSLMLTGVGYGGAGNVMGGVYVNPYDAKLTTSSGQVSNIQVFCDDYYAHAYLNTPWNVNTINFDDLATNLASTRWGNSALTGYVGSAAQALNLYRQAAWLSEQLVTQVNNTVKGQISYAIWGLFSPTALDVLSSTNKSGAMDWMGKANTASKTFTTEQFSKFVLYTPTPLSVPGSPQEFIAVRTPEPVAAAIWGVNVLLLGGICFHFRRRMVVAKVEQA